MLQQLPARRGFLLDLDADSESRGCDENDPSVGEGVCSHRVHNPTSRHAGAELSGSVEPLISVGGVLSARSCPGLAVPRLGRAAPANLCGEGAGLRAILRRRVRHRGRAPRRIDGTRVLARLMPVVPLAEWLRASVRVAAAEPRPGWLARVVGLMTRRSSGARQACARESSGPRSNISTLRATLHVCVRRAFT